MQGAREGCSGQYSRPSNADCANSLQAIEDVSDNSDNEYVDYVLINAQYLASYKRYLLVVS
jgi:hypothetical protein